jgi:SSS family solute:Na+ symporter
VWWKLSGIFAGGMLGIFLLGFLAKKVRDSEAKIAAALGLILIALMSFKDNLPEALQIPLDSKMTVVVGTLSIVGIGYFLHKIRSR